MERCLFAYNSTGIIETNNYHRQYIGSEGCSRSFYCRRQKIKEDCLLAKSNIAVSLVLPPISEEFFMGTVEFLSEILRMGTGLEIICNDFGVLNWLATNGYDNIIAGRILTRQCSTYLTESPLSIMKHVGIKRFELDGSNYGLIRYLKGYNVSFYNNYTLIGYSNDSCAFRKHKTKCIRNVCSCSGKIFNRFLNQEYMLYENLILQEQRSRNTITDRIIDVMF